MSFLGHNRNSSKCRERYWNHLKEGMQKGNWSEEEDQLIMANRGQWANLSNLHLTNRSNLCLKNRYHFLVRAQNCKRNKNKIDLNATSSLSPPPFIPGSSSTLLPLPSSLTTTITPVTTTSDMIEAATATPATRRTPIPRTTNPTPLTKIQAKRRRLTTITTHEELSESEIEPKNLKSGMTLRAQRRRISYFEVPEKNSPPRPTPRLLRSPPLRRSLPSPSLPLSPPPSLPLPYPTE